jgi:hypothetical protein
MVIIVSYPVHAADQAMAMECSDVHVDRASPSILSPANTFTIIRKLYLYFMIMMAIRLIIQYDITPSPKATAQENNQNGHHQNDQNYKFPLQGFIYVCLVS